MSKMKNTADMINGGSDIEEKLMNTLEAVATETTQDEERRENMKSEMNRAPVSFGRTSNVLMHVIGVSEGERW